MTSIRFQRRFPGGSVVVLGQANKSPRGWKFLPATPSRRPSRKFHKELEGCLPRWIGYPNNCESFVIWEVEAFGKDCVGNISGYRVVRYIRNHTQFSDAFFGDLYKEGSFEIAKEKAEALRDELNRKLS